MRGISNMLAIENQIRAYRSSDVLNRVTKQRRTQRQETIRRNKVMRKGKGPDGSYEVNAPIVFDGKL